MTHEFTESSRLFNEQYLKDCSIPELVWTQRVCLDLIEQRVSSPIGADKMRRWRETHAGDRQ
jgi:hypothetical protein